MYTEKFISFKCLTQFLSPSNSLWMTCADGDTFWWRHEGADNEEQNEHSHDGPESLDEVHVCDFDRLG